MVLVGLAELEDLELEELAWGELELEELEKEVELVMVEALENQGSHHLNCKSSNDLCCIGFQFHCNCRT